MNCVTLIPMSLLCVGSEGEGEELNILDFLYYSRKYMCIYPRCVGVVVHPFNPENQL